MSENPIGSKKFLLKADSIIQIDGTPYALTEETVVSGFEVPRWPSVFDDAASIHDEHLSDCAVHNEPAYPGGECDCGYKLRVERKYASLFLCLAHNHFLRIGTQYRSWK
jgi:hypothetical protein